MSDQIKGFTVTLKENISEESAKKLADAILMLKEVVDVVPVKKSINDYIVKMRVKSGIKEALCGFMDEYLSMKK